MAENSTLLNPLRADDLDSCAKIIDETPLFRDYGSSGQAIARLLEKSLLDPASDVIAARTDGVFSGFAWILKNGAFGRSAYLRLIATAEAFRGRGIGELLLSHAEEKHGKPNGLFLLTSEHNSRARAFYERSGYTLLGIIPGYVKADINECIYFKRV